MSKTAVVILAAGRGTRMRSRQPKVLHQAGGRTLLASVIAAARAAGFADSQIAVVAGYGLNAVTASLNGGIRIVHQERQQGTGHAVLVAQSFWSKFEQVVILNGDMPLLSAATVAGLAAQRESLAAAAVLATASPEEPRAYGRILRDPQRQDQIVAIVEDRVATAEQKRIRELNAGFYCFAVAPLSTALAQLGTDNPHGEYYLTDCVASIAKTGGLVAAYPLADTRECLGINDRVELAQLDGALRRRKIEELMRAGVTIQLPETVIIDPEVEVGEDTVIEAGVQLLGATRIGANCSIRAYSILTNCHIADGVAIRPHCVGESAVVERDAIVGPFSRLREGAEVGPAAHVGNFVEVKKSRIGRGAKANHLAYIGDATIGAGSNVGAGTITCNYDGVNKHPTTVGEGAFIGSNSTLVAPVEIGAGAYVAAGSVITEAVPADALGLGRSRQTNKSGWAARRKQTSSKSAKS